jgi:hypothetical protein
MGEMRNACKTSVGKPERKRLRGRPRRRWENNIRMDPREIRWEDVDWICLAHDRDRLRALGNEPSGSITGREFPD